MSKKLQKSQVVFKDQVAATLNVWSGRARAFTKVKLPCTVLWQFKNGSLMVVPNNAVAGFKIYTVGYGDWEKSDPTQQITKTAEDYAEKWKLTSKLHKEHYAEK